MRRRTVVLVIAIVLILVLFMENKAKAWGPITHFTLLDDIIKNPSLSPDVKKILSENLKYSKGGAVGPDIFYFFDSDYSDYAHYCNTGAFARKMLELAKESGDPKLIAFAYGWMIHVATDPVGHSWVNGLVAQQLGVPIPLKPTICSGHSDHPSERSDAGCLHPTLTGRLESSLTVFFS